MKKLGVGIATAYAAKNIDKALPGLKENQFLTAISAIDANDDVDGDGLAEITMEKYGILDSRDRSNFKWVTFCWTDADVFLLYIVVGIRNTKSAEDEPLPIFYS